MVFLPSMLSINQMRELITKKSYQGLDVGKPAESWGSGGNRQLGACPLGVFKMAPSTQGV